MSEFGAYAALAAFPIVGIFVFDWWNAGWASGHHTMVLPPEIARKREEANRPLILVKYALLLLILHALAGEPLWHLVPVTVRSRPWLVLLASGIVGGVVISGFRNLLSTLLPAALSETNEYFLRGSVGLWLTIFFVGGPVEEFWRALCIVALVRNGHGAFSANLLAAVAFSIAHQSGIPSRIAPGLAIAGAEVMVGLILGALFVWSGNVIAPCLASVIYYVSIFFLARRRSTELDKHQSGILP